MRVHLARLVDEPRVEADLASLAPVQQPGVLADASDGDRLVAPHATLTVASVDGEPARTSGLVTRRPVRALARSIVAAVLTSTTASWWVRSPTCAHGLSSVAHSTSQR